MGCPVSIVSSRANSSACAASASASLRSSRPRSDAAVSLQAGYAACADATARSTSSARASAISVINDESWGLWTSIRPPAIASTNSPPMKSWFCIALEVDWVDVLDPATDSLRQTRVTVLPDQEHGPLRAVALVPDVGRHCCNIARLHGDLGTRCTGLAVLDIPDDLVTELYEPFDPVVAVDDRKDVLLGSGAEETVLADADDAGVPGHIASAEIGEETECGHLGFEPGIGVHLGLILRDICEHPIHRKAALVRTDGLVPWDPDHPRGRDPASRDGREVVAVLLAERVVRLGRAGEGVEIGVGPVCEHGTEGLSNKRGLVGLGVIEFGSAVRIVESTSEEVDRSIVVHGPDNVVEVDGSIEEVPRDVSLERT